MLSFWWPARLTPRSIAMTTVMVSIVSVYGGLIEACVHEADMQDPVWIKSLLGVHIAAAIGGPAIALTTAYYKRKFAPRNKLGAASTA